MATIQATVTLYGESTAGNRFGLLRPLDAPNQPQEKDILFYEREWLDEASVPAVGDIVTCVVRPIRNGRLRAFGVRLLRQTELPSSTRHAETLAEIERLAGQRPQLQMALMTWRVLRQRESGSGKHQLSSRCVVDAGNGIFWSADTRRDGGDVFLWKPSRVLAALRGQNMEA